MDGVADRSLRQYRQFYLTYPRIWQTPSAKSLQSLIPSSIRQTLPANSLVEYALAGMNNDLFVSRYQVELPKKIDIQRFMEETIREVGDGK
jgi:hypothetical protein